MTDQARWNAVTRRESAADGAFVFAVRTTGVYCRPSCKARRPLRRNVEFFSIAEAAEAAGYRPCKRCRPRDTRVDDPGINVVRQVCDHLRAANGSADLARAAARVGKSPTHVRRLFKRILGMTPGAWVEALRRERLQGDLRAGHTVSRAQFDAGFSSSSRLYERSDTLLGMTPARYRNGGAGVTIRFGFGLTSLGHVLVATTGRGVCSVKIGTHRRRLESQLREEFPSAELHREEDAVDLALTRILEAIERGGPRPDVPVDVQATAFQARVWRALSEVPTGETRTYLEIARAIGAPNAVRAVASACAANPVAVVIPCHRIVRTDGSMGGYRWGVERKQVLLEREASASGATAAT